MAIYHISADKNGRIVIPKDVREHSLSGCKLGIVVDVAALPGNRKMQQSPEPVSLRVITGDKYNDIVFKMEALPDNRMKSDFKQYFERYVCLQPVDERGRVTLPKTFLKEILNFDPPGPLVFMVFPDEARLTTVALYDEACARSLRELQDNPVAHEDLGL